MNGFIHLCNCHIWLFASLSSSSIHAVVTNNWLIGLRCNPERRCFILLKKLNEKRAESFEALGPAFMTAIMIVQTQGELRAGSIWPDEKRKEKKLTWHSKNPNLAQCICIFRKWMKVPISDHVYQSFTVFIELCAFFSSVFLLVWRIMWVFSLSISEIKPERQHW